MLKLSSVTIFLVTGAACCNAFAQADSTAKAADASEFQLRETAQRLLSEKVAATANQQQIDTISEPEFAKTIKALVERQAASWNDGDIVAFMEAYWRDEKLTFSSGGKTTRGWNATRDRYRSRYPDKKTMGTLTFTELEVQALDDNAALMLGRWHLEREKPIGGNFSLVWQRIAGAWLIVHDHSSSETP